jgi:hypothetical protein
VSDTGVGIAPEDQDAIFEEFRQVGTADKKAEGTGLGLTLCRKFIELHGGRIWVKSQGGRGLNVRVHDPGAPRVERPRRRSLLVSDPAVSFSLTWLSAPGGSNRRWRPYPPTVLSVSTTQPLARIRGFLHRHARHGLRRSYGRGWGSP